MSRPLTAPELAAILAGLRLLQSYSHLLAKAPNDTTFGMIRQIWDEGGTGLVGAEIDTLCERLNTAQVGPASPSLDALLNQFAGETYATRGAIASETAALVARHFADLDKTLIRIRDAANPDWPSPAKVPDAPDEIAPIHIRCKHCGSGDVHRDAWADWNPAAGRWELGAVFDYGQCGTCEREDGLTEWTAEEAAAWDALHDKLEEETGDITATSPELEQITAAANAACEARDAAERDAKGG